MVQQILKILYPTKYPFPVDFYYVEFETINSTIYLAMKVFENAKIGINKEIREKIEYTMYAVTMATHSSLKTFTKEFL